MYYPEKKDLFFIELEQWFFEEYHIRLYDYSYDVTHEHKTRLKLIVWDNYKWFVGVNAQEIKTEIQNYFFELCQKYHHEIQIKPEIIMFDTLKDEVKKRILKQVSSLIQSIEYPEIWKIEIIFEQVHVFFETDEQCTHCQASGITNQINHKILEIVSPYDEFHVFDNDFSCVFTSHQTLNENIKEVCFSIRDKFK